MRVQHYFVTRLVSLDVAARNGPEVNDPSRGAYDVDRVDLLGDELARLDLQPPELKAFILANRPAGVLRPRAGSARRGPESLSR